MRTPRRPNVTPSWTSAAISDTLRVATAGDFDQNLPKLNLSERQIPIVVRLPEGARMDLDLISRLAVPARNGGHVPLGNVASIAIDSGPAQIDRGHQRRRGDHRGPLRARNL